MNTFETLFTANLSVETKVSIRLRKGVIIGALLMLDRMQT
jgi:hypothetical protein